MSSLLIHKIGNSFFHVDSLLTEFPMFLGDFWADIENDKFQLNRYAGSSGREYNFTDVTIQVDSGSIESFTAREDLTNRLKEISYPGIKNFSSGGATPNLSQVIQVGDLDVRDISEDSDLIDSDAYQQLNINSGGLVFSIPTISQTSGEFIVGHRYRVIAYVAGDDISNIGGTNASSTTFTATGTTATDYTNGSTIVDLTASAIIPNNSTVRINNTIVQNPDTGLTISFGVGCIVSASGSILSGSTLVIPNGVKCFLNHLQDLSFTVTYEVGSVDTYSTDEINTGAIWIDGKPIFRKTFIGITNTGDIDISALNIETLVDKVVIFSDVDGRYTDTDFSKNTYYNNGLGELLVTYNVFAPIVFLADGLIFTSFERAQANITLNTITSTPIPYDYNITIEYTKTT